MELRHDVRARMGPTDSGCSSGWRSAGDLLHLQPPSQPITKARTSGGAETLESTQAVASVDRFFERHGDQLLTWPTGSSASSRWPGLLGHRWPRKVSSGPDGKIRSRRGPLTSHRYRGPAPEDLRKMARALEQFTFEYCCVLDREGPVGRASGVEGGSPGFYRREGAYECPGTRTRSRTRPADSSDPGDSNSRICCRTGPIPSAWTKWA